MDRLSFFLTLIVGAMITGGSSPLFCRLAGIPGPRLAALRQLAPR